MATNGSSGTQGWTSTQAYVIAVVCLLVGIAVGCLVRASVGAQARQSTAASAAATSTAAAPPAASGTPGAAGTGQQITPEQLKHMADVQSAPLIEQLKSKPNDANLLAEVGNLYYDAQQYRLARDYYERSLKIKPGNADVRVDLGTTMWYLGDPDKAIEHYNTVLKTQPTKPNALMNLGVVEWQGKMNIPAAVAAWEKLLATNPNFEGKANVEHLIELTKKHSNMSPAAKAPTPQM